MSRENSADINKKFERKVVRIKTVKPAFILSELKVSYLNRNKRFKRNIRARASDMEVTCSEVIEVMRMGEITK